MIAVQCSERKPHLELLRLERYIQQSIARNREALAMKVLIVHAHHEPKSFSSALFNQAISTLRESGHQVVISDLYAEQFDPVSDRRNFATIKDPDYLKQQVEEQYASENNGFAPELDAEIAKLEDCDLLLFSFPLWWFGMPAIMKGWVDKAFPMGRVYGMGKLYENGLGGGRKKGMVIITTGGLADGYTGYGVNPSLDAVLLPIHHGVFWFNGFLPLDPFVAWGPARVGEEVRADYLAMLDRRLRSIESDEPIRLAPLSEFPDFGEDTKRRFMVTASHKAPPDDAYRALIRKEVERTEELKRQGIIKEVHIGAPDSDPWRAYLIFRESNEWAVRDHLKTLPLYDFLDFEIVELATALERMRSLQTT